MSFWEGSGWQANKEDEAKRKKVIKYFNGGAEFEDSKIKSEQVEPPPSPKISKATAIERCKTLISEHHLCISDLFKM